MSEEYITKSLQVGAFLKAKGVKFRGVKRDGRCVFFKFRGEGINDMVEDYFSGDSDLISAVDHWEAIRSLKSCVYEG